jgi:Flp pilus assembly protein TadG
MDATVRSLRGWRDESGAELIEFALAMPLLLLIIFGIIDFGLLFQKYLAVADAAREGARIAVMPDYAANLTTNVTERVNQYLDAAGLTDGGRAVTVVGPTAVSVGGNCVSTYSVTVTYPWGYSVVGGVASFFGASLGSGNLSATSAMRAEATVGACGP